MKVNASKKYPFSSLSFLKKIGPGLITGASDDDPSGIATYSQAGAQFGFATLWTALITFPLMIAIQAMCARIGVVTSCGLTSNIKKHYPKSLLYLIILLSAPAIILNIGADIAGMGAVANLVYPGISSMVFSIFFTFIMLLAIIFFSYQAMMTVLKYFCISLLLYFIIPFLIKQNWISVLKHTFIPTIYFNKEFINILVAILGTTISPYLFFWQATLSAEEKNKKNSILMVNRSAIKDMNYDVSLGMFASNLVMYFIILSTGSTLFPQGISNIDTVEQAATALKPLAGNFAYFLFASGVIGTGLLTIPVLSGSLSYILSTAFNWNSGLDKAFYQAKEFYGIIIIALFIGLGINFLGISPIKALIGTALLYGLCAPILVLILLHIANNEKIMGKFTNSKLSNWLGGFTFFLLFIAGVLLIYLQFN